MSPPRILTGSSKVLLLSICISLIFCVPGWHSVEASDKELPLDIPTSSRPQIDVFFVLDVTSSMQWAIADISEGILGFAERLEKLKIDYRLGLLAFRDLTIDEEPMILLKFKGEPFTSDAGAFRKEVAKLVAKGGGDIPESSLEAVREASSQPFRKDAMKVLFLITDAPPKVTKGQGLPQSFEQEVAAAKQTAEEVKARDIDAVYILVLPNDMEVYKPLVEAGQIKKKYGDHFFSMKNLVLGEDDFDKLMSRVATGLLAEANTKRSDKNPIIETVQPTPRVCVPAFTCEHGTWKESGCCGQGHFLARLFKRRGCRRGNRSRMSRG
jgi:hypothetical protein